MSPLLETYELLDYIECRSIAPAETEVDSSGKTVLNPANRQWVSHYKFALTYLMLSVNEQIGSNLLGTKTSYDA